MTVTSMKESNTQSEFRLSSRAGETKWFSNTTGGSFSRQTFDSIAHKQSTTCAVQ